MNPGFADTSWDYRAATVDDQPVDVQSPAASRPADRFRLAIAQAMCGVTTPR